ncbi:MAG: hypothetical protein DA408_17170 [Bacteroidetes bacterium]|nr:MAG: hypothetical protein C7N36_13300 [Bacteroidota bacterium]PTM09959.1 MAG: hypothetical protein DA408_17170 [Bacteroidota bacterium]
MWSCGTGRERMVGVVKAGLGTIAGEYPARVVNRNPTWVFPMRVAVWRGVFGIKMNLSGFTKARQVAGAIVQKY